MMALKLNIREDLDAEIDALYPLIGARSKTEYINLAIAEMNRRLRRRQEVESLAPYFQNPEHLKEEKQLLNEFRSLRGVGD
jgi:uncharacterized protein (UPF0276 family)